MQGCNTRLRKLPIAGNFNYGAKAYDKIHLTRSKERTYLKKELT